MASIQMSAPAKDDSAGAGAAGAGGDAKTVAVKSQPDADAAAAGGKERLTLKVLDQHNAVTEFKVKGATKLKRIFGTTQPTIDRLSCVLTPSNPIPSHRIPSRSACIHFVVLIRLRCRCLLREV